MARPTPVYATDFGGGAPSGSLMIMAIPEDAYAAISAVAAKRGMSVAEAVIKAITDFCAEKPA